MFEVITINCQTWFKKNSQLQLFDVEIFVFQKDIFFVGRRERLLWMRDCVMLNGSGTELFQLCASLVWLLNSTWKMMTCSRHGQIRFWGTTPFVQRYQNLNSRQNELKLLILDHLEYLIFQVPQCRPFQYKSMVSKRCYKVRNFSMFD